MDFKEIFISFFKEHAIALTFGILGLICFGYGLISLAHPQQANDTQFQNLQPSSNAAKAPISPIQKQITIDVEGAVEKPGVYKVNASDRIQDALIAAGGLSHDADRHQIAQNLNLAAPLTDGSKLYIPAVGEQMMTSGNGSSNSSGTVQGASTGRVNINQASEEALDALPGIGPVTAQKIISNRPYQSVEDLVSKKAVGASEFAKIKDQVSVY